MDLNKRSLLYKLNQQMQVKDWENSVHSSQDYFKTTCVSLLGFLALSLLLVILLTLAVIGITYLGLYSYSTYPIYHRFNIGEVSLLKELSSADMMVMIPYVWSMGWRSILILIGAGVSTGFVLASLSTFWAAILLPTEFKEVLKRIKLTIKGNRYENK